MSGRILVVDDDLSLVKNIEVILAGGGYQVAAAHTAEDGLRLALSQQIDLVLLDVMIPSMGGWEACRQIRETSDVPIIFLTALGNVESVVRGLEMGADDYIVKPFKQPELLARVKAHLRRMQKNNAQPQEMVFGDGELIINLPAHLVQVAGENVELTPREFDLLTTLACNAGRVMPTADLVKRAWGLEDKDAVTNLKPYIHYLRKKIEADPATPRWIVTVRGVGYRFADE